MSSRPIVVSRKGRVYEAILLNVLNPEWKGSLRSAPNKSTRAIEIFRIPAWFFHHLIRRMALSSRERQPWPRQGLGVNQVSRD